MIKENEIRIGNWFEHLPIWSYRNEDEKSFLFQWDSSDWYKYGECCISLDCIKPIKLTSNILINCGFEKSISKIDVYEKENFFLWKSIDNKFLCYLLEKNTNQRFLIPTCIYSLHELQNIYFYLFGKQLIFKHENT